MQDIFEQFMWELQVNAYLPMYVLGLGLAAMVVIYYIFYIRPDRITEGVTPSVWKKITPDLPKVEGTIHFRILNPKTGAELDFEGGDIYEYASDTIKEIHTIDAEINSPKLLTDGALEAEIQKIDQELSENLPEQPKTEVLPVLPIPALERQRVVVQKKTTTYVCLVRNRININEGRILAFRMHNLMSGQDLTSKMRKLKVIKFAPGKSKIHSFIIGILILYNFVLSVALIQNRPADFIADPVMYGWYFSVGLLWAFQKYLDWTQWGFWSVFRIERISKDNEFSFYGGKEFEIRLDVYDLRPHYYPGITLPEAFDVDPEEIAQKLNNYNEMKLKKAISRIISLKKDILFMDAVVSDLRQLTDQQNEKIKVARAEGYTLGRGDNDVSPLLGQPIMGRGLIGEFSGPLKVLIATGGLVIIILGIVNAFEGFSLQWADKILIGIFLVIVGMFAFLLLWRNVFTRPIGT